MRGAPARAIQELAGHQDLSTTQRYMHLGAATLDSAIQLLEPDDRRGNNVATGPDAVVVWIVPVKKMGGEPGRNRTFNPQIKSLLLCQLSYWPT